MVGRVVGVVAGATGVALRLTRATTAVDGRHRTHGRGRDDRDRIRVAWEAGPPGGRAR